MAVVSGRLQIRGWTDKDGNKRLGATVYVDKVSFTIGKGKAAEQASSDTFQNVDTANLPF